MQVRRELEAVIGLGEVVSERIVLEPLQVELLCCSQQEHWSTHETRVGFFFLNQKRRREIRTLEFGDACGFWPPS